MIGFVFEFCILDGELVEHSKSYELIKWLWGEEVARKFVVEREIYLSKPPPEREQHELTLVDG